jgi:phosphosulfolactate synthase
VNHLQNNVSHPLLVEEIGKREGKPRRNGLTMLIDKGVGLASFEETLQLAGGYIDFIKLGFGTTLLYPMEVLSKKLLLAKKAGVTLYPGGTLFELAYHHGFINEHFEFMKEAGFTHIEISDGTINLPEKERRSLIRESKEHGFTVITECGKKAVGSCLEIEELEKTFYSDLESGASHVIVEGRESGENVGIYDENGCADTEFLCAIEKVFSGEAMNHLIWEAPRKSQQIELILFFGKEVNMGNIQFEDAYNLECLRRGFRFDTFVK